MYERWSQIGKYDGNNNNSYLGGFDAVRGVDKGDLVLLIVAVVVSAPPRLTGVPLNDCCIPDITCGDAVNIDALFIVFGDSGTN